MGTYQVVPRDNASGAIEFEDQLTFGKSDKNDVVLSKGEPSRWHARIYVDATGPVLEDLDSTNGTFRNNRAVGPDQRLEDGDLLRFAQDEFYFLVQGRDGRPGVGADTVFLPPPAGKEAEIPWRNITLTELPRRLTRWRSAEEVPVRTDVVPPFVQVTSGHMAGAAFRLEPGEWDLVRWTIGSHEDRSIQLKGEGVSPFHAILAKTGDKWRVADQLSTAGVWVNGNKHVVAFLKSGDDIVLGSERLRVVLEDNTNPKRTLGNLRLGTALVLLLLGLSAAVAVLV